jgi:uncharacterized repeat protein (TIGR01451 family)
MENDISVDTNYGQTGGTNVSLFTNVTPALPDLVVSVTHTPDKLIAGETVTYMLHVVNNGPVPATNVTANITLPLGLTYLAGTLVPGGVCNFNTPTSLTCFLGAGGTLAAGASADASVSFMVNADYLANPLAYATNSGYIPGQAENPLYVTGVVTETEMDATPADNSFNNAAIVADLADLKVTKVASAAQVHVGDTFTYTIYIDNLGPSYARQVAIRDDILSNPAFSVDLPAAFDAAHPGTCSLIPADPPATGQTLVCTLTNALEPIGSPAGYGRASITLTAHALAVAQPETQLDNKVEVYTYENNGQPGTPDPNTSNNSATAVVLASASADLELTFVPPSPNNGVVAGGMYNFGLRVTNLGPSPAKNVVLTVLVPAGVHLTTTWPGCSLGTSGNPEDAMICNLGDMPMSITPNDLGDITVPITAFVDPAFVGTFFTINAWVTSDTFDAHLSNNRIGQDVPVGVTHALSFTASYPTTANAGDPITYHISIYNAGPSVAHDVTLTEHLPTQVTFTGAAVFGDTGSCSFDAASHTVVCHLDTIPVLPAPAFADVFVVVTGTIDPAITTNVTITNHVELWDSTPALAQATDLNTDVTAAPVTLVITKTHSPAMLVAGGPVAYNFHLANTGTVPAYTFNFHDSFPTQLYFLSYASQLNLATIISDCSIDPNNVLSCSFGTLQPGQAIDFTVNLLLRSDYIYNFGAKNAADLSNCATLDATNAAAQPITQLSACDTAPVQGSADLRITKVGPASHVNAGAPFTYTIYVQNYGPSYAWPVYVQDQILGTTAFTITNVDCGPRSCSIAYDAGQAATPASLVKNLTITLLGPLEPMNAYLTGPALPPPANNGVLAITLTLMANEASDITDHATVSTGEYGTSDPDLSNNSASLTTLVSATADLAITAGPIAAPTVAGSTVLVPFTVTNNGPSTADNVIFKANFPAGFTPTDVMVNAVPQICTLGTSGNPADPLTCGLGTLAVGQTKTIQVAVNISENYNAPADGFTIYAWTYSSEFDPNNSNNQAYITGTVLFQSDLTIFKSGPTDVVAGNALQYRLDVINGGPSVARDVVVTDTLPAHMQYDGAAIIGAAGACVYDAGSRLIRCDLGDLLPYASFPVTILINATVDVDAPAGPYLNTAAITSTSVNQAVEATWTVNVSAAPIDVAITKTHAPDVLIAGTKVIYTLTASNVGPLPTADVTVTDILPANLVFLSSSVTSSNNGNDICTFASGTLTCPFGTLQPGETRVVEVSMYVQGRLHGGHHDRAAPRSFDRGPNRRGGRVLQLRNQRPHPDHLRHQPRRHQPVLAGLHEGGHLQAGSLRHPRSGRRWATGGDGRSQGTQDPPHHQAGHLRRAWRRS